METSPSTSKRSKKRSAANTLSKIDIDQIRAYEKQIRDLTASCNALAKAQDSFNDMIYQQGKTITNLEKKISSQLPKLFRVKLESMGRTLRQLTDFWRELMLLTVTDPSDTINDFQDDFDQSFHNLPESSQDATPQRNRSHASMNGHGSSMPNLTKEDRGINYKEPSPRAKDTEPPRRSSLKQTIKVPTAMRENKSSASNKRKASEMSENSGGVCFSDSSSDDAAELSNTIKSTIAKLGSKKTKLKVKIPLPSPPKLLNPKVNGTSQSSHKKLNIISPDSDDENSHILIKTSSRSAPTATSESKKKTGKDTERKDTKLLLKKKETSKGKSQPRWSIPTIKIEPESSDEDHRDRERSKRENRKTKRSSKNMSKTIIEDASSSDDVPLKKIMNGIQRQHSNESSAKVLSRTDIDPGEMDKLKKVRVYLTDIFSQTNSNPIVTKSKKEYLSSPKENASDKHVSDKHASDKVKGTNSVVTDNEDSSSENPSKKSSDPISLDMEVIADDEEQDSTKQKDDNSSTKDKDEKDDEENWEIVDESDKKEDSDAIDEASNSSSKNATKSGTDASQPLPGEAWEQWQSLTEVVAKLHTTASHQC